MTLNSLRSNLQIQNSWTEELDSSIQSQLTLSDKKSSSEGFLEIGSNSQLRDAATGGSGTAVDPYILEGLTIITELGYGIFIEHTTSYFIIRNCSIESRIHGIYIDEIANGTAIIKDNFCQKSFHGIRLRRADFTQVINNTCHQNGEVGISTLYTTSVLIANNTCQYSSIGISLVASGHATVINNKFIQNGNIGVEISGFKSSVVNNTFVGTGVYIDDWVENALTFEIENNSVNGKPLAFLKNLHDVEINDAYGSIGQLILVNCRNMSVRNKTFTYTTTGITLIECSSVEIINCTSTDNTRSGIWLVRSTHSTITGSNCSNNRRRGIYLSSTSHSSVVNSSCNNNGLEGISDSGWRTNLTIVNNTCNYNNRGGISLITPNSYVGNNECHNNGRNGMSMSLFDNSWIVKNKISNNSHNGILLEGTNNCTIYKNRLEKNERYGINIRAFFGMMDYIIPSHNQIIFNKFLIGVNEGNLTSQANDDGSNNTWLNNYWSNWTSPDRNADGIVDTPYSIDGSANGQDSYPLAYQNPPQNHFLSNPTVSYPNGEETLSGIITIRYAQSLDFEGHSITYAFYYSADSGITWITLESGLTTNWYQWDTNTVADGANYLVKVNVSCSEGLWKSDTSDNTFTINNPVSTTTTLSSITTTSAATAPTTTSISTPSWNILLVLLSFIIILPLKQHQKKT